VRFGAFAVSCVPVQNGAHKYSKRIATVDDSLPLLQKLLPLEQKHQLTVRRGDQAAALKQVSPAVQPAPDNKLDFL
jgi:hypothetical protein